MIELKSHSASDGGQARSVRQTGSSRARAGGDVSARRQALAMLAWICALFAWLAVSAPEVRAQQTRTTVLFRATGDTAAVPRGEAVGGAAATMAARNAVGNALEATKESQPDFLRWVGKARIVALSAAVGRLGDGSDAFEAVGATLGADGVLDLKKLILSFPPGAGQVLIPASAPSSGPGALIIDSNGREGREEASNWVGTIYQSFSGAACTATLIGPRVLLTAAHCLERSGPYGIEIGGKTIALRCDRHPSYSPVGRGVLFDYGLCHLASEFPRQVAIAPRVDVRHVTAAIARVRSDGYVRSDDLTTRLTSVEQALASPTTVNADPLDVLAQGVRGVVERDGAGAAMTDFPSRLLLDVVIAEIAKATGAEAEPNGLRKLVPARFERLSLAARDGAFRPSDPNARRILLAGYGCTNRQGSGGNDNVLRAGQGRISQFSAMWLSVGSRLRGDSAIVCSGDSGGAAYRLLDDSAYGRRVVIAVNAQNINGAYGIENVSFLAKTAAPAFRLFFEAWRRKWGLPAVCGIDRGIEPLCHD